MPLAASVLMFGDLASGWPPRHPIQSFKSSTMMNTMSGRFALSALTAVHDAKNATVNISSLIDIVPLALRKRQIPNAFLTGGNVVDDGKESLQEQWKLRVRPPLLAPALVHVTRHISLDDVYVDMKAKSARSPGGVGGGGAPPKFFVCFCECVTRFLLSFPGCP